MFRKFGSLTCLLIILVTSGCILGEFPSRREIREGRNISNFTVDADAIYFGAAYKLYRINLSTRSVEEIYSTDRIRVEQPIVADGVAYFGGVSYVDERGNFGERQGFFAVDLRSRKSLWKFPLGVGGYGTYGTYPVLAGDRILVCAREHLHCLDRRSGKELWKVDNWLGRDTDGTTVPYAYNGFVYFKIREEYFTGNDSNDGHWAKVALDSGGRTDVLPIAETPGKYHDTDGDAIGILENGVVYGATRYDSNAYPASRFGALDLEARKLLWEVRGSSVRTRPAISSRCVFTISDNSIEALDKKTGDIVWKEPLGEIVQPTIERSQDVGSWEYENKRSRRLVATDEVVVTQGSQGVVARRADNGRLLWLVKIESEEGDADPLIFQRMVIVSSAKDCSILAVDLMNGRELWRVRIPDCRYHYILDD